MKRSDHSQGTDNVLRDLGFDDAEELSAKAALALKLNELIDHRGHHGHDSTESVPSPPLQAPEHFTGTADAGTGVTGPACGDCGAACAAYSFGVHYGCCMSRWGLHRGGWGE